MDKEYAWKLRSAYQEMIKTCHGHYDESYIEELKDRDPQKKIDKWLT